MAKIGLPDGKYLTSCEVEVLRVLYEGVKTQEAADVLSRSPRTIDFHCANIHKKLGTRPRGGSVLRCVGRGDGLRMWRRRSQAFPLSHVVMSA